MELHKMPHIDVIPCYKPGAAHVQRSASLDVHTNLHGNGKIPPHFIKELRRKKLFKRNGRIKSPGGLIHSIVAASCSITLCTLEGIVYTGRYMLTSNSRIN